MKTVVLCGGGGTRLFPLSRESYPKQFLEFKGKSFLQRAYNRALLLSSESDVAVSTNKKYFFLVRHQLGEGVHLILEPAMRNTTAAFIYAIRKAEKDLGWDVDDVFVFMPTDHLIEPDDAFAEDVKKAASFAQEGRVVVIGIPPTEPKTGFGYIKVGKDLSGAYEVVCFVEKPKRDVAKRMLEEGGHFWNSGIYIAKGRVILEELSRLSPEFSPFIDMPLKELEDRFGEIPSLAIDYSLAERTDKLVMVPASFSWSDVGSWDAYYEVSDKDALENVVSGREGVLIDTRRSLVISEDAIPIVVGVDDIVVVNTKDVLLVVKKGESQRVRDAVELLKNKGVPEASLHKRVYRPWGYYEELLKSDRFRVKKVHVYPGKRLSLQMHHHRSEHWVVVKGTAKVTVGDKEVFLHENESVYVPKSVLHRIENVGKIPLEIVEVQTGEYVEEDDIIRVEDDWGRKDS